MAETPRRRWFTFSLRTLFVAMTLLACWLGWELNQIRDRKTLREQLTSQGGWDFVPATSLVGAAPPGLTVPRYGEISHSRKWLGDEGIAHIWFVRYHPKVSDADIERVRQTFPEANVSEVLAEPCHPGCFPRGTSVETPTGQRPIETIAVGDWLNTVSSDGRVVAIPVESVFVTTNRLWRVTTESGELLTTETQPLCGSLAHTPLAAGQLKPGDRVLRRQEGKVHSVAVLSVERTDQVAEVFNLVLGNSEIFVAGGHLARSKPPEDSLPQMVDSQDRQVLPVR